MFKKILDHIDNPQIKEVLPSDVLDNMNDIQMLDVREPDEFTGELGHIKGAKLIPLGDLAGTEDLDFSKPTVFICRSGGRSARATFWAMENGADKVYNMRGGMLAWNKEGLEIEK